MKSDLVSGVVLLAIALLYYAATNSIADSTLSDEVGATGLPRALAWLLAGLGLLLVARAVTTTAPVRGRKNESDADEDARMPRALGFLMFGAAYILALPVLGYFVSTALLIASVALFERAQRSWAVPATAAAGAILYWAVFVKLLGVNQPVGAVWQGLLS